jgi:hypothetical protein
MARAAVFGPKLTSAETRRLRIRLKLDPVYVAISDGLFACALKIAEDAAAKAPDDPMVYRPGVGREPQPSPGYGLRHNWGVLAWANGKVVKGLGADGSAAVSKPRGMRTSTTGADAMVGFGFPGRYNETGTVHNPARPFLAPAAVAFLTSSEFPATLREHFPKGDDEL